MRPARLLLLVAFVLGLVVLLVGAVVRTCLTSPQAAARAAAALAAAYGGRASVETADINLDATTLTGVRLFEADATSDDPPWAEADSVQADVSLWNVLGGQARPQHLRLDHARVTLRFDETGRLLTRLPKRGGGESLPVIQLSDGRLTLQQKGRPDLVAEGIDATLEPSDDGLRLTGCGLDPRWGEWGLDGGYDADAAAGWLTLRSAHPVRLTAETLEGLPFVSSRVWKNVRAAGDSTVELTLRYQPAAGSVSYRVLLDAENTDLTIVPIDLHATTARGRVLIENSLVTLSNVTGRTGNGDIHADGTLDFRAAPSRMEFDVRVNHVDIQQLPGKWPIPKFLEGRLTGQANLVVSVVQGKAKTIGQGEGQVMEVPLGFGKKATIPLKLTADEHGFHFTPRWPKAG